jgi:hypothetical protein
MGEENLEETQSSRWDIVGRVRGVMSGGDNIIRK